MPGCINSEDYLGRENKEPSTHYIWNKQFEIMIATELKYTDHAQPGR